jgi:hypothetical protein
MKYRIEISSVAEAETDGIKRQRHWRVATAIDSVISIDRRLSRQLSIDREIYRQIEV